MSEVKKDLETVSAGRGIFFYPIHKGSTLTSLGTIRVKPVISLG
jgi:hypothetical protein